VSREVHARFCERRRVRLPPPTLLAIPTEDRATAERALLTAQEALGLLRLELDPAKTRVVSFDEGVPFLGQTITATTGHGVEALSHPLETVVYVDRQHSLLRSRGDRLVVEHQGQVVFKLNLRRVRQVVCLGRVGMTTPFVHQALHRGIDVVLLTEHGQPGGRLQSLAHSDPTIRRAQYRTADDPDRCLELARWFVDGKIANLRTALLRADRRQPDPIRTGITETLEITRLVLADATSLDELRGHEGTASREYFRGIRLVIGGDWGFAARQRHPPPDPVNAMLSFGYTLLLHEAVAALEAARLDPAVGFLHQTRWGRPNLALDLMEELRPTIVDAVVLRCVTTGMIKPEDFETVPDRGCLMTDRARHTYLAAYERRMLTLFTHAGTGRRVSYRVGLGLQAKALARTLVDSARSYHPIRWK
jgi:CRISPR-associated endonuclease Cas1